MSLLNLAASGNLEIMSMVRNFNSFPVLLPRPRGPLPSSFKAGQSQYDLIVVLQPPIWQPESLKEVLDLGLMVRMIIAALRHKFLGPAQQARHHCPFGFFLPPHRAAAAFLARSCRSSAVIFAAVRLPPIGPPFFPPRFPAFWKNSSENFFLAINQ